MSKLNLPEGPHVITLRNQDFAPFVTTVQVTADKAATVRHRFGQ
jgi:serine/threonine-protein kinase